MEQMPKGIYTPEFRAEAFKLVETKGLSIDHAAKRLSVPKSSLSNWVRAARSGKLGEGCKGQRLPSELELELARTRKEQADVKMERDLQKSLQHPPRGLLRGVFREGVVVRYGRIDELRQQYPVVAMCRVLDVSESGYLA